MWGEEKEKKKTPLKTECIELLQVTEKAGG